MKKLRPRLTFANVASCLALFVALGGSAYAATQLPKNSVGAAQLKPDAVTASKVKAGSLLASNFKSGQLPAGERGPQGIPGPEGHPGANATVATEEVHASSALDTTTPKEISVECPNGPVRSGGYVLHSAGGAGGQGVLRAVRDYAVASNTWLVRATDDSAAETWELTVSAVCAK